MNPLSDLYDRVARGETPPPRDYNDYKLLLTRARHAARTGDLAERQAAVAVTAAIGGHWALSTLREFTADADPTVRRQVLVAAVAAGEPGLTLLRDLAMDAEVAISLEALGYLQRAVDRGSASRMRQLLTAADPRQRAAAATLLGSIAGAGLFIPLRDQRDREDDPEVKQALTEAMARIDGSLPRATPDPWWLSAEPEAAWEPPAPLEALPDPLPTDTEPLLRLLGRARSEHQIPLLIAISEAGDAPLQQLVRGLRVDRDPELAIGGCVAARLLREEGWAVPIRRLLPDRDPGVRIAVAEALAVIGKASVVMGLRDLLSDPVPRVRIAGLLALRATTSDEETRRYTYLLKGEQDPDVLAALADLG